MDFLNQQHPPPKHWQQFEDLCLAIFKGVWKDPIAQKNGRGGQAQAGTDVYNSQPPYVGVQCKGKDQNLGGAITEAELREEIGKAESFKPPLTHWTLVTTAPKDAAIEELARVISAERQSRGRFTVQVMGWGDLEHFINENDDVKKAFYQHAFFDVPGLIETVGAQTKAVESLLLGSAEVDESRFLQTSLLDDHLEESMAAIRQARHFGEFPYVDRARRLALDILDGRYRRATARARGLALAWTARLLASEDRALAERSLVAAKTLIEDPSIMIAEAFLSASGGDVDQGLAALGALKSHETLTAMSVLRSRRDGPGRLAAWCEEAGLLIGDFDADGKILFLASLIECERWSVAENAVQGISPADFAAAPLLLFLKAGIILRQAAPDELSATVFHGVPFHPKEFPLKDDAKSLAARREATATFAQAAQRAQALKCPRAAAHASDMALWLRLRDAETRSEALEEVACDFRRGDPPLRRLNLAVDFGVRVDLAAIESLLNRQTALSGGDADSAVARLTLALTQKTERAAATYLEKYMAEILRWLDPNGVKSTHVELLVACGALDEARAALASWTDGDAPSSAALRQRLTKLIENAPRLDAIERMIEDYNADERLPALSRLVGALEGAGDWRRLSVYAPKLFARTAQIQHAELTAIALMNDGAFKALDAFLGALDENQRASETIKDAMAWSAFHQGRLAEALHAVKELPSERNEKRRTQLEQNIYTANGDWESLSLIVDRQWSRRQDLSAKEILATGVLAAAIGDGRAKTIIEEAADRAGDDPFVLAGAYHTALKIGWDEEKPAEWLARAAAHSGEDGPIQRFALKDLQNFDPGWRERVTEASRQLDALEIPIAAAAKIFNTPLIDRTLTAALFNLREEKITRRSFIQSFSAHRPTQRVGEASVAGIDVTALFTLHLLGAIEKLFTLFPRIVVPHATFGWLFEEEQRRQGLQHSEERKARDIVDLVERGRLTATFEERAGHSDLSEEVGADLASMLHQAREDRQEGRANAFVVRSAPVHRVGAFMEEAADLTAWRDALRSCSDVVNALFKRGEITASDRKAALDYLKLHEQPWSDDTEVPDGAVLYLDDLSVSYLHFCGVIDRLAAAGFSAVISKSTLDRSRSILSHARVSGDVNERLDELRKFLTKKMQSGALAIAPQREKDGEVTGVTSPTIDLFSIEDVDAIIIDDRFFNRHDSLEQADRRIPIRSSLDVLDDFVEAGSMTADERLECLGLLRAFGHIAVPISKDELLVRLAEADTTDGVLRETLELRRIREYLIRIRTDDSLLSESQMPWFLTLYKSIAEATREVWLRESAPAARAKAEWLFNVFDCQSWSRFLKGEVTRARRMRVLFAASLSMPLLEEHAARGAYFEWLEERVLRPMKDQDAAAHEDYLQYTERLISIWINEVSDEHA